MTDSFQKAVARNHAAAKELDRALRDCLAAIKDRPDTVVEGRFRVLSGGRRENEKPAREVGR